MPLKGLHCQVSKLDNSDACPRPTAHHVRVLEALAVHHPAVPRPIDNAPPSATDRVFRRVSSVFFFYFFHRWLEIDPVEHLGREMCQVGPNDASWPAHSCGNTAIKA
jgi:hypothetical protein